jgi:hypothetical protein
MSPSAVMGFFARFCGVDDKNEDKNEPIQGVGVVMGFFITCVYF